MLLKISFRVEKCFGLCKRIKNWILVLRAGINDQSSKELAAVRCRDMQHSGK